MSSNQNFLQHNYRQNPYNISSPYPYSMATNVIFDPAQYATAGYQTINQGQQQEQRFQPQLSPSQFSPLHAMPGTLQQTADVQSDTQDPAYYAHSGGMQTRSGFIKQPHGTPEAPEQASSSNSNQAQHSTLPNNNRTKKRAQKKPAVAVNLPLSVLLRDEPTPLKDMDEVVNRSGEDRRADARRKGRTPRPQNSFMLYRSCFADRIKAWADVSNHQIVSSISGQGWALESQEVRNRFEALSKRERDAHSAAFPEYKFNPAKNKGKRTRADCEPEDEDAEEDAEMESNDQDSDYKGSGSGRRVRQKRSHPGEELHGQSTNHAPIVTQALPYYGQPIQSQRQAPWGYHDNGQGMMQQYQYNPYSTTAVSFDPPNQYAPGVRTASTPMSAHDVNEYNIGEYGIPSEEYFMAAMGRDTPMQRYNALGHPVTRQYSDASTITSQQSYMPQQAFAPQAPMMNPVMMPQARPMLARQRSQPQAHAQFQPRLQQQRASTSSNRQTRVDPGATGPRRTEPPAPVDNPPQRVESAPPQVVHHSQTPVNVDPSLDPGNFSAGDNNFETGGFFDEATYDLGQFDLQELQNMFQEPHGQNQTLAPPRIPSPVE